MVWTVAGGTGCLQTPKGTQKPLGAYTSVLLLPVKALFTV